jgi:glucose-6-phosphate isomerase
VFGWPIVEEFLAGAHDMDTHFVEMNPRHNLPVLLALMDVWNDTFLNASVRAVTPFTEAFAAFPAFVGALESQTCSRASDSNFAATSKKSCSSMVLDGGSDGSYDRAFYQSSKIVNSELIMAMDSQVGFNASRTLPSGDDIHAAQDALICSLFAHADELAFGNSVTDNLSAPSPDTLSLQSLPKNQSTGNRPSVLLMCGRLDAFVCGQLIALSEHRAVVKAHIWDIDPFVHEIGSSLRIDRTDELQSELVNLFTEQEGEDDEEPNMTLSTKTLLGHYANLMKGERIYTVHGEHK